MDKDEVDRALGDVFDKPKRRLEVSGQMLTNEHTDEVDGAEVDFEFNRLKPDPPLTEENPK